MRWGVQSICAVLIELGVQIAPSTYYDQVNREPSRREVRDTRRILGWRVAATMTTAMVLDSIEQAIWTRQREGVFDLKDVVHHTDRGSQYTSTRFTERLAEAGIQPSVGAVGSSYDNSLAETINGLYKTELIKPRKPWRTIEGVELATAEWVDWFNRRRVYEYCGTSHPSTLRPPTPINIGDQPPAELTNHQSLRTHRAVQND